MYVCEIQYFLYTVLITVIVYQLFNTVLHKNSYLVRILYRYI